MAIIYVYTYDDPKGVGCNLPPTVAESPQGKKLIESVYHNPISTLMGNGRNLLMFDNEEQLLRWIEEHRITDPALLADIEMWNKAYGIVHHHTYYTANNITLSVNPVF